MSLYKTTNLGKIKISDNVFASIMRDGMQSEGCRGRVWPATKRGKQIGNDVKINLNDFVSSIEVELDEFGRVSIDFSVIVRFGTSISKITDILSDYIAEKVKVITGEPPGQIKIRVSGVKSKQIARRNTEVIKTYEVN